MPFTKGVSGNSAGRPAGKTAATELKKIIADNMPDILHAMIDQAKSGDTTAAKALLDKVVPSLKSQALPIKISIGDSLSGAGDSIINATMKGKISPDTGSNLISALVNQAKLIEVTEIISRIEALERTNK